MGKIRKLRGSTNVPDSTNYNPKYVAPYIQARDLNTMIYQQGVRVKVYKTLWCPNRKSIDGAEHNINCPLCKGSEFLDIDPCDSFAFIQGQQRDQKINPEDIGGGWEEQTVMASFISGVELSYYTKVELVDYTNVFKELVQRQLSTHTVITSFTPVSYDSATGVVEVPSTIDMNLIKINQVFIDSLGNRFVIMCVDKTGLPKFKIAQNKTVSLLAGAIIQTQNIDRLRFKAHSVDRIIDQDGVNYYEGNDFEVDRNGDIEWTGNKPADKKIYSIHYHTLVAFRAIRAIHSNRFGTDNLKKPQQEVVEYPQQWVLKKLFLFRKEDSESGQRLDPNTIFGPGE